VHHFFRRHVYSASRGHMSRPMATVITFLISALAHELVMGCITRKFRGYGFIAMMLQMPIVMVQRSKWIRGRTLLNNVLFWCSMILGLSMVSRAFSPFPNTSADCCRCAPSMFLFDTFPRRNSSYKHSLATRIDARDTPFLATFGFGRYCRYRSYCRFIYV
jgi:hypothetical protein